jgi:hypothetical protein
MPATFEERLEEPIVLISSFRKIPGSSIFMHIWQRYGQFIYFHLLLSVLTNNASASETVWEAECLNILACERALVRPFSSSFSEAMANLSVYPSLYCSFQRSMATLWKHFRDLKALFFGFQTILGIYIFIQFQQSYDQVLSHPCCQVCIALT